MKKFFVIAVMACALTASAQAQNLFDAAKRILTETVDDATGGKLTAAAIYGTWNYSAPAVKLGGDDMLSDVSGSAVGTAAASKMKGVFEKIGIKPGACSITFCNDGTFSMPVKSKTVKGTFEFDPSSHAITMHLGKVGEFKGYAYISGSNLQLVFSVEKFVQFVVNLGSNVSALSSITSMLKRYENAYLGFEFAK